MFLLLRRFSHRKRQEESQRDPVHRRPDQLPGHADEDQSEAPFHITISDTAMEHYYMYCNQYSLLCAIRCEKEP